MTTGRSGNIYFTGSSKDNLEGETNSGDRDIFLAKYDGSGNHLWVIYLVTESEDHGDGLTIDKSGSQWLKIDEIKITDLCDF